MRKEKKDYKATYSDNNNHWNHGSFKVDVVGIVTEIGRMKSYTQSFGYNQVAQHQKYFMALRDVVIDGQSKKEGLKVMVDCCEVERQKHRPGIGTKIHFKTSRADAWANISESAPLEFWGEEFEASDDRKWISEYNLQLLEVKEKSVVVGWILPVNAEKDLPDIIAYAKKYRNESGIPIYHWSELRGKANGVLGCGTVTYTGNFTHETSDERMVNCKRCLLQMKKKADLVDVLLMNTYFPKTHVRLKGDRNCAIPDYMSIGAQVEVAEWIWDIKLKEEKWFVEVKRVRADCVDKVLDLYSPKGWSGDVQ